MSDGPFQAAFNAETNGVIRREIVSYRLRDGMMIKETASRDYYASGDYHDSQASIPLPVR